MAELIVLLVVALFVARHFYERRDATSSADTPRTPPPIPVVADTARTGDIGVYITGLGTVTPLNTVTVKTRVDGQLMAVSYQEGQRVRKGDPLVEIDPRPYEAQLAQAQGQFAKDQAALQNALVDLSRYQALIAKHAVAQQVLQTQQATVAADQGAVQTDQANVDTAKLNIAFCHISASVTGRVGLRLVDPGNMVSAGAGTPLAVIAQMQPISVIFTIPEQQVPDVRAALAAGRRLPVDALSRDLQSTLEKGELTTLDNQIDQSTGTLRLRASFSNQKEALFPNQFVNARLLVREEKGVTLVANAAVQRNTSNTFVYLVKPDHHVTVRQISIGATDADDTEVVKGVSPGDIVVTQGVDRLQEGSLVSVRSPKDDADDVASSKSPGDATAATSGRK